MIGAGAAGLAASRHLIGCGIRPSIFESSKVIGGSWSPGVQQSKMWDSLTTNLSKYTCRFSDFPWPERSPTFPTHLEMHQYLLDYSQQYVDPNCFKLGCHVTKVQRDNNLRYTVEWMEESSVQSRDFDGVVVATGFFSKPYLPEAFHSATSAESGFSGTILHSSDYRAPDSFQNQTVAVIGSSFSALEISVDVSTKASRVLNIVPRIPWVIPRYIPMDGKVLPVDVAFYRRSQDAPQTPEKVTQTPEMIRDRHAFLKGVLGTQKQLALGMPDQSKPLFRAISDDYLSLVQQGTIEVVHGRAVGVSGTSLEIEASDGSNSTFALSGLDSIIACTGFHSRLDFLDRDILDVLQYDPLDPFCPLTLCYDVLHPQIPNLGFCGMYQATYFGVVELQARLIANLWSGNMSPLDDETLQAALETARTIRNHEPRAQMPHSDYIGHLDTLAELLKMVPPKDLGGKRGDVVSPAFYQPNRSISEICKEELEHEGDDASHSTQVVLNALIGPWNFERVITHFDTGRQELVTGVVQFTKSKLLDYVIYREDGLYHLTPQKSLQVFREYEYIDKNGILEIYFVEGGKRAHLFLSLKFTKQEDKVWVATSDHLCIKDLYQGTFEIELEGIGATSMTMTYRVKGPQKDYESVTRLRPAC